MLNMKSFFLILACFSFAFSAEQSESKTICQHKPLKLIEQNDNELVDISDIEEDTPDYMVLQKLKRSDTIILVCFFEVTYTPYVRNTGRGNKYYPGRFIKDKYGRIVQALKGNISVGEPFVLREFSEMPPDYPFSKDEVKQGKITQPVSFPLKGDMSYVVFHTNDTQRENGTIIHENRDVDSEFRCFPNFQVRLSRFLKVKPATIERYSY